ncbi:MAG: sodium:solute symporter, partial [Chthoniobacterales bacterium]
AIGLYVGRGDKSIEGFAVGNRSIPWWAVLASILAAEISAATFLGAPGEGYANRNFTYAQLAIGTILARFIIAFVFIKPYYDFRVVSIYEYLALRFGTRTKNAASAIFLITRALASGTRLYVAAIVFVLGYEMITGNTLGLWQQVWVYVIALTFITTITSIYTALGGIKAVIWTDVIQACIMFGSLGFAIWALFKNLPGGWADVVAAAHRVVIDPNITAAKGLPVATEDAQLIAEHSFDFWNTGILANRTFWGNVKGILDSEYTIWAALIGSTFTTMATHGTDQDMVQRMLTAKDHVKSRLSLILSGLADLPLVLIFLFIGILLWALYQQPGKTAPFAYFIVHQMPAGIRGILIAGIFATAMGSLSTALNALATSFTEDWYRPYIRKDASPTQVLSAARKSTVAFSILLIIIGSLTAYAAVILHSRIIPIVLGIFGYTYGSLLGIFLVGLLTKRRGSERGNLIGMLCGFIVVAILSGLHNDVWALLHPPVNGGIAPVLWAPAWLPHIEFPWRVAFGTVTTFAVALLFRTPQAQLDVAAEHMKRMNASSAS